jgi:hypothetical protein
MFTIAHDHSRFPTQMAGDVAIYSCTRLRDPELEPLIGKALATRTLLSVRSVRRNTHDSPYSCILHKQCVCLSSMVAIEEDPAPKNGYQQEPRSCGFGAVSAGSKFPRAGLLLAQRDRAVCGLCIFGDAAVANAVTEINHQADHQPHRQPQPVLDGQGKHKHQAT